MQIGRMPSLPGRNRLETRNFVPTSFRSVAGGSAPDWHRLKARTAGRRSDESWDRTLRQRSGAGLPRFSHQTDHSHDLIAPIVIQSIDYWGKILTGRPSIEICSHGLQILIIPIYTPFSIPPTRPCRVRLPVQPRH